MKAVKPIPDRQFLIPKLEEPVRAGKLTQVLLLLNCTTQRTIPAGYLWRREHPDTWRAFVKSLMNCKCRKKSKKVNSFLFVLSFSLLNSYNLIFLRNLTMFSILTIFFMSSVSSGIYRKGLLRPRSKGEYHSMCLLILIQAGCHHPLFPWVCTMPEKNVKMGKRAEFWDSFLY